MSMRITTAVLCVAIGLAAIWSVGEMAFGQVSVADPPGLPPGTPPALDPMKPPPGLSNDQDIAGAVGKIGKRHEAAQRAAADAARAAEEAMREAAASRSMGRMRSGGRGRSSGMMGPYGDRGDAYGRSMTGEGYGYGPSSRGMSADVFADGMPIGMRSSTPWANSPDPKVIELLKQDRAMEKEGRVLAQKCLASQGAARETLRKELEDLTTKHFELRQKRRQMEIEILEKQLERVKATLDKRNNGKDLIIQRRIAKLLGEEDELAF
jgi:hypothetical protein